MKIEHKNLAAGDWQNLTLIEQLANVGSEVHRAISWKSKENGKYAKEAADRALELFDLTLADSKNKGRLREIARARELFADYFYGENAYNQTAESWQKYFYNFNYLARI